ncbi:MAG: hypothetical protein ACSHX8_05590 [Opitutaceae bacterium]
MQRRVQPELLDDLPSGHPDALSSRKDLVRINQLMGNGRWLQKMLIKQTCSGSSHLLEIGAGDGTLAKQLISSLKPHCYTALDLAEQPHDWPTDANWVQGNLLAYNDYDSATHLLASLILHHFKEPQLAQLGELIKSSGIQQIIACEPCRRAFHKTQLRAGKLIGFNHVTLHDGCVSVDAGFRGDELPQLLGLDASRWKWTISETFMGAYRMHAQRR